jgi:hypothetical protein
MFPGISGLAAMVWIAYLNGRLRWPLRRLQAGTILVVLLGMWLVVKLSFVQVVIPLRNHSREARAKGEQLATLVPEGEILYLFRLKDEGIMFYFGRTVRRLHDPNELPSPGVPVYCILDQAEWMQWRRLRPAEVLLHLSDEQGAPIVLVRVSDDEEMYGSPNRR